MKNFLGVTNDVSDYSIGYDVLTAKTHSECDFITGNPKWCSISTKKYIINFHTSCKY